MSQVIMKAEKLKKVFGSFVANEDVSFSVEKGKIYALAGENGAGKSTLMKMLYGVYKIDDGTLYIDGERMDEKYNPSKARDKGLGMVFQDFRLVQAFTVLENVYLSSKEAGQIFNKAQLRKKINELAKKFNLKVNPDEFVWRLDLGQRQHVEIIKVLLNSNTRVLIFDEPTSVLAPNEIQSLLDLLKELRSNGYSIILITHKIHEIVQVADYVYILRKGRLVHTFDAQEGLEHKQIVSKMIGEYDSDEFAAVQNAFTGKNSEKSDYGKPILAGYNIDIKDDYGRNIIAKSNIELYPGMILGVAGISGNGQRELTESLYGIRKIPSGKLLFGGEDFTNTNVKQRLEAGIRILSEDPIRDNLVPDYTVLQHMAIAGFDYKKKGTTIDWKELDERIKNCAEIKGLNVPDSSKIAEKLSGGNIQRMVFAKNIIANPKVLIASYPSRGLDIATVSAVHETLYRLKEMGCAILLISEDLNELFKVSDRLVVLSQNTIQGPYVPEEFDSQTIGEIMLKGANEE